jgi:UDP-N-acetyl-D-glucosamine dehydrogenase
VLKSQRLAPGALKRFDCVVVVTDHDSFDYELIVRELALVVDCRNAIRRPAANVVKL